MLSREQKKEISTLIRQIELKTEAELVAIVSQKSGDYGFLWLGFSLVLGFIFSLILILFAKLSLLDFFFKQVFFMAFCYYLLTRFESNFINFLPEFYKKRRVFGYAKEVFSNFNLSNTNSRVALLFFVSVKERYAHIITDEGIKSKIKDEDWQEIMDRFILHVKAGEFVKGYKEAISECGEILSFAFPIKSDDENELFDEVIEL